MNHYYARNIFTFQENSMMTLLPFLMLGLATFAYAQKDMDPVRNMCYRFWHQSTVKNGALYIDGGMESFVPLINGTQPWQNASLQMGYNDYLLKVDLSTSWDWKTNISEVALNKTKVPSTGTAPPSLISGALYQGSTNDPRIYMYGGTTNWWNTTSPTFQAPQTKEYSLWSYDTQSKVWGQHDISDAAPWRPSVGATTEAPELGLTFWYGGEMDSGSSTETQFFGDQVKVFLEGMVVYNTSSQVAMNISTQPADQGQPRTRGSMQYIPGIGEKGILVYMGGTHRPANEIDNNVAVNYLDMSELDIFDVASLFKKPSNTSTAWHHQKATGDIPLSRGQFCAVTASAPDNSSHNIYIYGGWNEHTYTYFDDVYVLSLPSFTWTMLYGEGSGPRFGHTCHLVGNRQMLTVGGVSTLDVKLPCDWETKGVGVLDMSTMMWGSVYDVNARPYQVPQKLINTIGGSPQGNASITQPIYGFNSSNLAQLFGVTMPTSTGQNSSNTSTTTISSSTSTPKPNPHIGAIAGGAAAGGVGLIAILGLVVFLVLRRKKTKRQQVQMRQPLNHHDYINSSGSDSPDMTELAVPPVELAQQRGLYERQELSEESRMGELASTRWKALNAEAVELEGLSQSSTSATRTP